jgi:hypothetical protein
MRKWKKGIHRYDDAKKLIMLNDDIDNLGKIAHQEKLICL